jgi:hypothetical protein
LIHRLDRFRHIETTGDIFALPVSRSGKGFSGGVVREDGKVCCDDWVKILERQEIYDGRADS